MKMKRLPHKIFFITLPSILIFLIMLEMALRVGGYLYIRYRNPQIYSGDAASGLGAFNILCLGDSFTQGIGATSGESYPSQLQRLLDGDGFKNILCINGGTGGKTSSLILKDLRQIDKYRPRIIVILVGCNNRWNLKESSYFLLNGNNPYFLGRISGLLRSLKIYKLAKIGFINLRHRFNLDRDDKKSARAPNRISPASRKLLQDGINLYGERKLDLAKEKLQQAISIDKNNAMAHLELARIYVHYEEFPSAKEEMRQVIMTAGELSDSILCDINNLVRQLDKTIIGRESLLTEFKELIKKKYPGDRGRREAKAIDEFIGTLEKDKLFDEVLEYDLSRIINFAKKKGINILLQTYPYPRPNKDNNIIRRVAEIYNIPLVDNETAFVEIGRQGNLYDFFVSDGHCNARGYGVMAGNVYDALLKYKLLPENGTEGL